MVRCTKIIRSVEDGSSSGNNPQMQGGGVGDSQDEDKYVINVKQFTNFVVGLGEKVAPTDVEKGMRVGVDRSPLLVVERSEFFS